MIEFALIDCSLASFIAIAQMKLASEMLSARQVLITDKFSQLQETGDELKRQRQEAYAQHQNTTPDTDNGTVRIDFMSTDRN